MLERAAALLAHGARLPMCTAACSQVGKLAHMACDQQVARAVCVSGGLLKTQILYCAPDFSNPIVLSSPYGLACQHAHRREWQQAHGRSRCQQFVCALGHFCYTEPFVSMNKPRLSYLPARSSPMEAAGAWPHSAPSVPLGSCPGRPAAHARCRPAPAQQQLRRGSDQGARQAPMTPAHQTRAWPPRQGPCALRCWARE